MSENITAARPYAQAAFQEAQKQSDLKGWSDVVQSLAEAIKHPEVSALVINPRIAKKQIEKMLAAVLGDKANALQLNFVRLLIENQRLLLLPQIAEIFEELKAEAEKTVNVIVDSAFELSAEQQQKITNTLKARMGREIKLLCRTNKDLLGGVVIRAGDKVIDGSARARLNELSTALA